MNFEFTRQIFKKYPNIKFHENPSNRILVVACGQTNRLDKANSRFSKFCECANRRQISWKYVQIFSRFLNVEMEGRTDQFLQAICKNAKARKNHVC
jgi:hypothetical protein